jgi:Xaa-Pro aminopeptidase
MPIRPFYMNQERFETLLADSPFDAVIASSFNNVYYSSGALIETQRRIPLRLALVVWPKTDEPTLIVGDIEETLARRESYIEDVRAYVEFQKSPIEALCEVLEEKGLDEAHLGIEMDHLMARYYQALKVRVPKCSFAPADRFFDAVRKIKTTAEVDLMQAAARATERAIYDGYSASQIGFSEKQIALYIIQRLLTTGADSIRFMVLGTGENSAHAHHIPTDRRIAAGDTIRLDCGAYFNGYASDIARMAFVAKPGPAQLDLYHRMYEIHQETLAAVRPGVRACDVYQACARAFEKRGLTLTSPHVGHGFGVGGGHEEPMLQPLNDEILKPGMVIAVEPVHRDPQLGGYHIEDLLLIAGNGAQKLSDATDPVDPFVIDPIGA